MRNILGDGTILGYCTNVHAGDGYDAMVRSLRTHALAVKQQVSPDQPMGVGLWLSARTASELLRGRVHELRQFLDDHGLLAYTFNAFPYGNFHSERVKHAVYQPDWRSEERLAYTLAVAELAQELCPADQEISISTLPIGWGPQGWDVADQQAAAEHLRTLAARLEELEASSGRVTHVDIEPEPGCVLQRSHDVVDFFDRWLRRESDRRYIRACHDICHAAVMREAQEQAVQWYEQAGVEIGKVQISSAIELPLAQLDPAEHEPALAQLTGFAEDRYLHQTTVATPQGQVFFEDLPDALAQAPAGDDWRVHFHVPIYLESFGKLRATGQDTVDCLELLTQGPQRVRHYEVETYAWNVLPESLREGELADGIARELAWVRDWADRTL